MSAIKKTVSIDKDIAKAASAISRNFSAVVEAALIAYIQHYKAQKAIETFGKWNERNQSSINIVNDLRRLDEREYVDRNIRRKKIKKTKG